jgi:hypothetical protein
MSPCFPSLIIESRFLCIVALRRSESLLDNSGLDRSRRSRYLHRTGARLTRSYNGNFSVQHEQHESPGNGSQNRDGNAKPRIIPEANFEMFPRGFDNDHVRNRTEDWKIDTRPPASSRQSKPSTPLRVKQQRVGSTAEFSAADR